MTIFWTWVCYHIIMEPGHVVGHYFWPNRTEMTDEFLGIPPLDAE